MSEFLGSWYGVLAIVTLDLLLLFVIALVSYRWFFKYFADFLCGLVATIVTLPVWLPVAIISKVHILRTNEYQTVFTRRYIAGMGGRKVPLLSFTVTDGLNGELTKLGAFLRKTGIEKLPVVFDILFLKLSIIGIKPLSTVDEKFIAEEDYDRFSARPGFINPLLTAEIKDGETTYEDMFESDKRYAEKCSLFTDLSILFTLILQKIRGEKRDIFGEIKEKTYPEVLLERGVITQEDYAAACAEEEVKENTDE